jgi:hypothetical protein
MSSANAANGSQPPAPGAAMFREPTQSGERNMLLSEGSIEANKEKTYVHSKQRTASRKLPLLYTLPHCLHFARIILFFASFCPPWIL